MIRAAVVAAVAAVPVAWPLANGLSGFTFAGGGGGPSAGYVSGEYSFPLGPYLCLGPELGAGFGNGGAIFFGGAGRFYLNRASASIFQPHLFLGGGFATANDEAAAVDRGDTGGYLHFGGGCDLDIPESPIGPFFNLGAFVFPSREPAVGFIFGAGIRLNVGRAVWMEQRRRERLAEDKHVAEDLARAREANDQGNYPSAIAICGQLLEFYPDREEVRELLLESERLLAESIPEPEPEPEPRPKPRPTARGRGRVRTREGRRFERRPRRGDIHFLGGFERVPELRGRPRRPRRRLPPPGPRLLLARPDFGRSPLLAPGAGIRPRQRQGAALYR